jgi:hypothetical protein
MNNGTRLMNSSISGFRSSMEALVEEETEYVIRLKYKVGAPTAEYETTFPEIVLGQYNYENTEIVSGEKRDCFVIEKELFRFEKINEEVPTNEEESTTGYIYGKGVCETSVSKEALINWDNRYGLFLHF